MDYGVALGRRFRALKLWFVLRAFGLEGLRSRLRYHLELAAEWVSWIQATPGWELAAPCPMATPIFRWIGEGLEPEASDAFTEALMEGVNRTGRAFVSHTRVDGRLALRLSIGNIRTSREHLAGTWALLQEQVRELTESAG
jgi:aromatic-L-amino-acid decarboxylase